MDMERYEAAMRETLDNEESHCAWTVAAYEAAEREEEAERKRADTALKRARRRATKATERQCREEAERQRVELVAEIKREAREEVRVMRGLRKAERVEARRVSKVDRSQSERRWRGGSRRPSVNKTRNRSSVCTESVLSSVCRDISSAYDLLLPVLPVIYADVLPASIFHDVVSMFRSKRRFSVEERVPSSIVPLVLLVDSLCILVHKRKLQVWRAGACHIDSMCRLGYG